MTEVRIRCDECDCYYYEIQDPPDPNWIPSTCVGHPEKLRDLVVDEEVTN